MRAAWICFFFAVACGPGEATPSVESIEPVTGETPASATNEADPEASEREAERPALAEAAPNPAENPTEDQPVPAEAEDDYAPSGEQQDARVESDPERGLTFSVVYRLAAAIGTPRPTLHGRPKDVGNSRFVVLVSFAEAAGASDEAASLRPEIWLVQRDVDGQTWRTGVLPIGHVPATDYLALSVGEVSDTAGELFDVRASRAGDFDDDGQAEFELVVEVDDEVVCGLGLLSHRWYMIFNVEPELTLAADIALTESSYRGALTRATAQLVDHNGDGHPDIKVRAKTCTEGDYADEQGCQAEETSFTHYLWDAEGDRWTLAAGEEDPCEG